MKNGVWYISEFKGFIKGPYVIYVMYYMLYVQIELREMREK